MPRNPSLIWVPLRVRFGRPHRRLKSRLASSRHTHVKGQRRRLPALSIRSRRTPAGLWPRPRSPLLRSRRPVLQRRPRPVRLELLPRSGVRSRRARRLYRRPQLALLQFSRCELRLGSQHLDLQSPETSHCHPRLGPAPRPSQRLRHPRLPPSSRNRRLQKLLRASRFIPVSAREPSGLLRDAVLASIGRCTRLPGPQVLRPLERCRVRCRAPRCVRRVRGALRRLQLGPRFPRSCRSRERSR